MNIENLIADFKKANHENCQCVATWMELARRYLEFGYRLNYDYCVERAKGIRRVAVETKEEEAEAEVLVGVLADQSVTAGLHRAWQSILRQLQAEIPRASFDTWVRGSSPVHCGEGKLQIAARNAYAIDWLSSRMTDTINHLLDGLQVEFVVGVAMETE